MFKNLFGKWESAETKSCRKCVGLLIDWVYGDGSWFIQVLSNKGFPLGAISARHRDRLQSAVSPVDVAVDPIYGNTLWGLNPTVNDCDRLGGAVSQV